MVELDWKVAENAKRLKLVDGHWAFSIGEVRGYLPVRPVSAGFVVFPGQG